MPSLRPGEPGRSAPVFAPEGHGATPGRSASPEWRRVLRLGPIPARMFPPPSLRSRPSRCVARPLQSTPRSVDGSHERTRFTRCQDGHAVSTFERIQNQPAIPPSDHARSSPRYAAMFRSSKPPTRAAGRVGRHQLSPAYPDVRIHARSGCHIMTTPRLHDAVLAPPHVCSGAFSPGESDSPKRRALVGCAGEGVTKRPNHAVESLGDR
jgi:hypothetical protein